MTRGKVDIWRNHILDKAIGFNVFSEPLQHSEVKAIAKSVSNWVWKHMQQDSPKFIERQRERGRKGGVSKGAANFNKRLAAEIMKAQGIPISNIARELGISVRTVHSWKLE